jgi:glycogen(starch) synthase
MEDNIENPSDYGIYIVDRRMKSVEESIQQLAETMLSFCLKSRRQRINQRNRTERLSELLDWKRMGMEYVKARHLALRRKFPESFVDVEDDPPVSIPVDQFETDDEGPEVPKMPGTLHPHYFMVQVVKLVNR